MYQLRPHQEKGKNLIRDAFRKLIKSILYVLPTGGGKTVIFCDIARATSQRGKRVWILVHRIELLRQTSEKLTENGVKHGLVNPKYTPDMTSMVQVVSVQTVIRRLAKISPDAYPDLIIIDEAHHATAGTWKKIIDNFEDCYILGVTATPIRRDGTGLDGIFDELICGPQISELIEDGYLVKPLIYGVKNRYDFSKVDMSGFDYDAAQLAEMLNKPTITGDAVEHYKKICPGVPTIVFCVSIEHSLDVAEAFRSAGFKSFQVDGSTDDTRRRWILDGLANGNSEVVCTCDLVSEGTDIPSVICAINLRPTQSLGLYIQQGGRPLRAVYSPGYDLSTKKGRLASIAVSEKPYAIILDHVGNVFEHGGLDEDREWSLSGKKKNRKSKKEKDIRILQCPKCYICSEPALECVHCGYVFEKTQIEPPKQIPGELLLLSEVDILQKKAINERIKEAKTLKELHVIGKELGYAHGWAYNLHKARNKNNNKELI